MFRVLSFFQDAMRSKTATEDLLRVKLSYSVADGKVSFFKIIFMCFGRNTKTPSYSKTISCCVALAQQCHCETKVSISACKGI